MDEHVLAKHGQFARELEELERLGMVARPEAETTPKPDAPKEAEHLAETLITVAILWLVVIALMLISVVVQILYGVDVWPLDFVYVMPVVIVVILGVPQLQNRLRWWADLPEPHVLRRMSDSWLRLWHRAAWLFGLALVAILMVWANAGQVARLVVLSEGHETLENPLNRALALFATLIALILVIPFQIAIEARRRTDKAE